MNRSDLQQLARTRLREATYLLDGGFAGGAYYLAGYAVECGLKACIAKQTRRSEFPPDPGTISKIYTHDLVRLVKQAGLEPLHARELAKDAAFLQYWSIVKDWSEQVRYETRTIVQARDLHRAITDPRHGVMRWLRRHW